MKIAPPLLPFALALSGCASGHVGKQPLEGPARLGQTVFADGPTVRPIRVIEDSRCPENARCVWAGRLVVRALVSGEQWTRQLDLTLGQPMQVADGTLTLVSAVPAKSTRRPVKAGDYRFTFQFQGGL